MKIDRGVTIIVCFILFSLLFSVFAYAGSGAIQVQCTDAAGKLLKGVIIVVLPLNSTEAKELKSDGKGLAEFKDMEAGVYRIVGRKKNYAPAFYEFVTLQASRESVSLTLAPGVDAMLYFEDAARIQKSSELMLQGVEASKAGRYEDAKNYLLQSLELYPSSSQSLYYLGVYYLQVRNFDPAVETLRRVEKLTGMFADLPPVPGQADPAQQKAIYENTKRLIMNMAGIKGEIALKQKDYDGAVAAFTEHLKNNPNDPGAHYQLALALTYAGQFDEAIGMIDKAIQMKPGEKDFTDLKTQISVRIENIAIEKAQAALNEGNGLLEAGDAAGALKKYQEVINLLSQDKQAPIWIQIGRTQVKLNQPAAAEEAYRKAIELAHETDAANYLNTLAQFYLNSKKFEEMLDALTDPRALGSNSKEKVLLDLVEKTKNREPKLAEAALERLIKADPGNADYCFTLGRMYYADGPEMGVRTTELLKKYIEIGKDPDKIRDAKDMLLIVGRRSK
jgi:tetratricopeptide (TPR) repeat protein